jgi:hypothetical protein
MQRLVSPHAAATVTNEINKYGTLTAEIGDFDEMTHFFRRSVQRAQRSPFYTQVD